MIKLIICLCFFYVFSIHFDASVHETLRKKETLLDWSDDSDTALNLRFYFVLFYFLLSLRYCFKFPKYFILGFLGAPVMKNELGTIEASLGESLNILCNASGEPPPHYQFYKVNKLIYTT